MGLFKKNDHSEYVKEELATIQEKVAPSVKKSLIYTYISMPLIFISVLNIYTLFVYVPITSELTLLIIILALIGAFGMALFKEARHHNKHIHETSLEYIKERIKNSHTLAESSKQKYLDELKTKPYRAISIFCDFLKEEENDIKDS